MPAIGLVGRDTELDLLHELVTDVVAGIGHVVIRRLLGGEFDNMTDPAAAAAEQAFALVAESCDGAPAVLVVDDLQWADPMTIGVWERLARAVGRLRLLLIGVQRPVPQRPEMAAVRRLVGEDRVIRLGGLADAAVEVLVAALSEGRPGKSLMRVAADAAGNPLYLTELVAALSRSRRLERSDIGAVEVTEGPVPGSLLGAIANRMDRPRPPISLSMAIGARRGRRSRGPMTSTKGLVRRGISPDYGRDSGGTDSDGRSGPGTGGNCPDGTV